MKGIAIYPDKRVEEFDFDPYDEDGSSLRKLQSIVDGSIEAVRLPFGTMYVNESFLLRNWGPQDFNSIATDVAGVGGRFDLLLGGILGPVAMVGPVNDEGYDTEVTIRAARVIERVRAEATL